jgi:hypothetical protein
VKKFLILLASAPAFVSNPASAAITLVAGWDTFTSEPESSSPATHLAAETTAVMSGSGTGGGWNDWSNSSGHGSSVDGTFGNLSALIASADTTGSTGSNQNRNLSLNRSNKPGQLVITVTNDSGLDRTLDGFYFDSVGRFGESAKNWELSYSGAISGTSTTGVLTQTNLNTATPAQRDKFVDLTALADNVWEAGSDAIFTLDFTGGTTTGTGGGHETLVDNIGITADVVPEPSGMLLSALGLSALLRRRRK